MSSESRAWLKRQLTEHFYELLSLVHTNVNLDANAIERLLDSYTAELREKVERLEGTLPGRMRGVQAVADEKCRCFLERAEAAEARCRELEDKLTAIVKWLEGNQPDVFRRGLWDALPAPPLSGEKEKSDGSGS